MRKVGYYWYLCRNGKIFSSLQYDNMMYVNLCDLVSFQMKRLSVLPQQCLLLMTCLLMALEAVPIDIDKTKVKAEGQVEGEKVENPVSIKKLI